jgi:hypothetical protein
VPRSPAPAGLASIPVCQFLRPFPLFSILKWLVLRWNDGLDKGYDTISRRRPSRYLAITDPRWATFEHPNGVAAKPCPNGIYSKEG